MEMGIFSLPSVFSHQSRWYQAFGFIDWKLDKNIE